MKQSEAEQIGLSSLVAEHVMGLDPVCAGPWRAVIQQGDHPEYRHYYCRVCNAKITVGPNYTGLPKSHRRNCPDYEHNMNAAWQVVGHFNQLSEDDPRKALFRKMDHDIIWLTLSIEEFCRAVCIYALKACRVIDE